MNSDRLHLQLFKENKLFGIEEFNFIYLFLSLRFGLKIVEQNIGTKTIFNYFKN